MRTSSFYLGLSVSVSVAALCVSACSDSGGGGGGGSPGTGGSGNVGNFGGTSGTGGVATGGVGASAGAGGSSGSGGTAGTGGATDGGTGTPADHVLFSEVGIEPGGAEFVEIYNPTSAAVDLSNYYLADNSAYHKVTSGPWNPGTSNPGTDWLVQFPSGTQIAPGAVITVAGEPDTGNDGYEKIFGSCPDFTMNDTAAPLSCGGGSVTAMLNPTNGGAGDKKGGFISNSREMVVLFTWDGSAAAVKDVDYVTWGGTFDNDTRADKTGVTGYVNDTARGSQKPAVVIKPEAGTASSIQRCQLETGEKLAGGNGMTGHDETSEDLAATFQSGTPSPGTKNSCLP